MHRPSNLISCLSATLVIALFVINRLGYLNLPFYWDEAWSYANAVFDMAAHGLTVLPGDGNPELTRGHPLVFYFLSALWVKILGTKLTVVHIFPLLISITLLIAVFYTAMKLFNKETAMAAIVLFALQAIFLAQSTMLLPEIMLSLWTILTIYAYFRRSWGLYTIFSALLVMTKETGIVLIGVIYLDKLLLERFFAEDQNRTGKMAGELAIMSTPLLVFAAFIIMQKVRYGWFLYPEHLSLTVFNPGEIAQRARMFISKLLFHNGRNIYFLLSVLAFLFLAVKRSISKPVAHLLSFSIVFIIVYIVFSSVNFFTARYLLSILPLFIMSGSWLITTWLKQNKIRIPAMLAFALLFAWHTFVGYRNEQDTSLAFRDTVLLQRQAVNFAEEMQWQHKKIYTAFLMQYYLSMPQLGYLNNKAHPFIQISNKPEESYDIYIFCSNESDPLLQKLKGRSDLFLIKRFEDKTAWVEIFGSVTR